MQCTTKLQNRHMQIRKLTQNRIMLQEELNTDQTLMTLVVH